MVVVLKLIHHYLVVNVTGLVQFGKNLYLTSTCLLELLAAEYLHETNTSIFFISLMVICSSDALKKCLRRK